MESWYLLLIIGLSAREGTAGNVFENVGNYLREMKITAATDVPQGCTSYTQCGTYSASAFERRMTNDKETEPTLNFAQNALPMLIDCFEQVESMLKPTTYHFLKFHTQWPEFLSLITGKCTNASIWNPIPLHLSIVSMSLTDTFMNIYWPFRLDIAHLNQKLALYGMNGSDLNYSIKTKFLKKLNDVQGISFPFAEGRIVLSFNDPTLVDGLNSSNLVSYSLEFMQAGKYRFDDSEQAEIKLRTSQALELIRNTSPQLYQAINELVGCIAFYKAEKPGFISGTIPNTIGLIWIDPSGKGEWDVEFYAEQIVHEFIHTSLFYAELVHTVYAKRDLLTKVKTVSAIRRELRDYDRSFHAAYVSAGLVTFNSRIGMFSRAEHLASTLRSSVEELVEKNEQWQILTQSGNAMLQFLDDYTKITRLET